MTTNNRGPSGWVLYATTMFAIVGAMNILYGLAMIINNEWVVFGADKVWYLDLAAWGWITLLVGILAITVSLGVYSGQTWARVLGVVAASVAALDAFVVMPYYPGWAIAILALSLLLIWALTAHGDEIG